MANWNIKIAIPSVACLILISERIKELLLLADLIFFHL